MFVRLVKADRTIGTMQTCDRDLSSSESMLLLNSKDLHVVNSSRSHKVLGCAKANDSVGIVWKICLGRLRYDMILSKYFFSRGDHWPPPSLTCR